MLTAILFSVICQSQEIPQAAFTARVYLPGKTRSYYDVYLWRGPGKVDRLTKTTVECSNVRWVSRNVLEWDEGDGSSPQRIRYDLANHKRTATAPRTIDYPSLVPPTGHEYAKRELPELAWFHEKYAHLEFEDRPFGKIVYKDVELDDPSVFSNTRIFVPGRTESEFFYFKVEGRRGSSGHVYRIDFKALEVERIIEDCLHVEIHAESPFWCGNTDYDYGMTEFDGMQLYVSRGFVGNWQTGEMWDVMPEPAVVTSVSLRPPRRTQLRRDPPADVSEHGDPCHQAKLDQFRQRLQVDDEAGQNAGEQTEKPVERDVVVD